MVETIKVACAMDDDVHLTKKHFGESRFYKIFELDEHGNLRFVEKIENNSVEEKMHGDPRKAASVSGLLKDTKVLLCCAMEKNVIRMRKEFCPVILRVTNIEKALEKLKKKYSELSEQVNRKPGEDREIIRI